MTETRKPVALSQEQARALKKKLRSLRWHPEAVMREIALIQKLRLLVEAPQSSLRNPEQLG